MLSNWRHSGFLAFCGNRICPKGETAMGNLARYILRASFSQERMQYLAGPSKVVYRAKDGTGGGLWSGWLPCVPTSRTRGSPADGGSMVLWALQ